ncbi:class I SAM-dependent methyltransferase [Mucilaginibacter pallidiroseus]|uniref:Class I SAM-dependent methyltransferase n=1 Tax=Mucilaginibacter pallidiroseus TaxID=2599295 RepID=A0A563U0M0_9SPHI|nr:class I SAM-dependent methyltransferase [Mucilaginibacter pallidiroseus]TWR25185.1 class I SAM-dependent methyltransferase [Mucilaginibacter pallidiroseus]
MRQQNLQRLNNSEVSNRHSNYLHYVSYHRELFKAIKIFATGRLLDIGCGNKPYQDIINLNISEYVGCDIIQSSDNLVDIICKANEIPVFNNTFDTVISTQTIEHVEDHQGLVNEAFRVLKLGGHFILSGPMYWPLHEEPYDFFRFTKHGLKYIVEKAGFEVIEINANGGKWSVAGQAFLHALYPQVYGIKGLKGKFIRACIKLIGGIKSINRFFLYLDNKYCDEANTMNYVLVAKKI